MNNYSIFDVESPLMDANVEIQGKTPIDAVKKYLKQIGNNKQPKRSASNYVKISAREFKIESDGRKVFTYKPTQWYELINAKN